MYNIEKDTASRLLRSFVQFLVSGAIFEAATFAGIALPPIALFVIFMLTVYAQLYADEMGIPYPGRNGLLGRNVLDDPHE